MKIVLLNPLYEAEAEVAKYISLTVECFTDMSGHPGPGSPREFVS